MWTPSSWTREYIYYILLSTRHQFLRFCPATGQWPRASCWGWPGGEWRKLGWSKWLIQLIDPSDWSMNHHSFRCVLWGPCHWASSRKDRWVSPKTVVEPLRCSERSPCLEVPVPCSERLARLAVTCLEHLKSLQRIQELFQTVHHSHLNCWTACFVWACACLWTSQNQSHHSACSVLTSSTTSSIFMKWLCGCTNNIKHSIYVFKLLWLYTPQRHFGAGNRI